MSRHRSHDFYFTPDVQDEREEEGDLDELERNPENDEEEVEADNDDGTSVSVSPVEKHSHWPQSYRQSMDAWASPGISHLFSPASNRAAQSYLSPYPSWRRRTPHLSEAEPLLPPPPRVVPTRAEKPPAHAKDQPPVPPQISKVKLEDKGAAMEEDVYYIEVEKRHGSSFFQAMFNGVNILAGVGLLSTPYAVAQGGWLSLTILFFLTFVCCYTALILRSCLESQPGLESYPDIGEAAFGQTGRFLISIALYVELYACCVEFLILEGDNLAALFPNATATIFGISLSSTTLFVLVAALCIIPTVWLKDLSLISYVSAGGVIASIVVLFCVAYVGAVDGVGFTQSGPLLNIYGIPVSIGLYGFCYSGHAVFPNIYTSMADKKQYNAVITASFIFCFFVYSSMAVMGFLMFGSATESQITLNLPTEFLASKIAMWTTVVNPFTKFALSMTPVALSLEELLPLDPNSCGYRSSSIVIRTLLVVSTVVVAITIPFFAYVMAFIGSFLSMTVSVILPCACYLQILGNRATTTQYILCYFIMTIGVICAISGTYSSLLEIINSL